jgi:hypothetical protein
MSQAIPLDEHSTNTEPEALATGARCEMLNFDFKVVDAINLLICTIRC